MPVTVYGIQLTKVLMNKGNTEDFDDIFAKRVMGFSESDEMPVLLTRSRSFSGSSFNKVAPFQCEPKKPSIDKFNDPDFDPESLVPEVGDDMVIDNWGEEEQASSSWGCGLHKLLPSAAKSAFAYAKTKLSRGAGATTRESRQPGPQSQRYQFTADGRAYQLDPSTKKRVFVRVKNSDRDFKKHPLTEKEKAESLKVDLDRWFTSEGFLLGVDSYDRLARRVWNMGSEALGDYTCGTSREVDFSKILEAGKFEGSTLVRKAVVELTQIQQYHGKAAAGQLRLTKVMSSGKFDYQYTPVKNALAAVEVKAIERPCVP